jgi:hypothetical protein
MEWVKHSWTRPSFTSLVISVLLRSGLGIGMDSFFTGGIFRGSLFFRQGARGFGKFILDVPCGRRRQRIFLFAFLIAQM